MKKILFAIFAVAALALTGCEKKGIDIMSLEPNEFDNTEFKCWKFTVENARILNDAHLDPSCVLMLISTHPLSDADECQRRVVDTVYKPMQAEEV